MLGKKYIVTYQRLARLAFPLLGYIKIAYAHRTPWVC